jgi:argininosuccinate lyase
MLVRAAARFARVADDATRSCPLGSGACSGSTLPLDRAKAAQMLGFEGPSGNALDAIGNRDVALDLLHAVARALGAASRASEELVIWCTPAYGYARLDDAASTGSSLMPQKRNPDPFELVRAHAAAANGALAGALGTTTGIALSYHRDLQETKAIVIRAVERGLAALEAFAIALDYVRYDDAAMSAHAGDGYTVATDLADALVAHGISARVAHELVGRTVSAAEADGGRPLNAADLAALAAAAGLAGTLAAPLTAEDSVRAKRTAGSTAPGEIAKRLAELEAVLASRDRIKSL